MVHRMWTIYGPGNVDPFRVQINWVQYIGPKDIYWMEGVDQIKLELYLVQKDVHLLCFDMNVARHLPTFLGGTNNKAHTGRSR